MGFGEAAPLEPYDGVSVDAVVDALREGPPRRGAPPQARAAWELAELDLQMRRLGRPLRELGARCDPGEPDAAGGPAGRGGGRRRARPARRLLLLQGEGGAARRPRARGRRARARRDRGPRCGSTPTGPGLRPRPWRRSPRWSRSTSQLVEQPCATLAELAEVRAKVGVPVAADESIAGADDVREAAALEACDAVNVKLAGSGGFGPARDALRAARDGGVGGLAVEHARRPVGDRGGASARSRREPVAGVRARHAGAVRRRDRARPASPAPTG